jgi:hypothetical protein
MKTAFVLGNGRSRLSANLHNLKKYGKIYGCNALYRDFTPDYLIAVDTKMVIEITNNNIQYSTSVWTNHNPKNENYKGVNFFKPSRGWSSGPTALLLACQHGYDEIYILGFDYLGIESKFNNVYSDTKNYKKSSDNATFHGNWQRQTEQIIKEFDHQKFIRVIENNGYIPDWRNLNNLAHLEYSKFNLIFNGGNRLILENS